MVQKLDPLKELVLLHKDIWFQDDERKYDDLEHSVEKLLELRGHTITSKVLAKLIRESYEIYGSLDDEKISLPPEFIFDEFIFSRFDKIYSLAREKNPGLQAKYHSRWWKSFYEKNQSKPLWTGKIINNVFQLHLAKFGIKHTYDAGLCTRYLIQAGYAQHKRNLSVTVINLQKYWEVMNKISSTMIMF